MPRWKDARVFAPISIIQTLLNSPHSFLAVMLAQEIRLIAVALAITGEERDVGVRN